MKDFGLTNNLSNFTPTHGVPVGSNPNQPETDREIELVIKALRLFNVGAIDEAEKVIAEANFSDDTRKWIGIELTAINSFISR